MDCTSRPSEPARVERTFNSIVAYLYEALFSFEGGLFEKYFPDLQAACEDLATCPDVSGEPLRILGTLRQLLRSFDLEGYAALSAVERTEKRKELGMRVCQVLSRFWIAEKALLGKTFETATECEASCLTGFVERLDIEDQIRADIEELSLRRLVLRNARAYFWYRPNRVRWALTSLEHAVDRQAECRMATISMEEIVERTMRLREASRRLITEDHTLLGLEVRNRGAQPVKFSPRAGLLRIWLGDDRSHDPRSGSLNANLTHLPIFFMDEPGEDTRDSLAGPEMNLSDGVWDYAMGGAIVNPGETHLGIMAFQGKFDHIAMAGLREGGAYVGAQASFYAAPA